jgi:hypothetical protein
LRKVALRQLSLANLRHVGGVGAGGASRRMWPVLVSGGKAVK